MHRQCALGSVIDVVQRIAFRGNIRTLAGIERHGLGFHRLFFAIAVVAYFEHQGVHACGRFGLGVDVKRGLQIGIGFTRFRSPFGIVIRAQPAVGHALFPWGQDDVMAARIAMVHVAVHRQIAMDFGAKLVKRPILTAWCFSVCANVVGLATVD